MEEWKTIMKTTLFIISTFWAAFFSFVLFNELTAFLQITIPGTYMWMMSSFSLAVISINLAMEEDKEE